MTARVRLYGYVRGESSFHQVSRGMRRALEVAGELAGVYAVDVDPEVLPEAERGGEAAPIALNCGDPAGLMRAHRAGGHREHWLLLAPNSEGLPHGFVESLTKPSEVLPQGLLSGGLLAPSAWAARVLRHTFPGKRVIVAPHGVTPELHVVMEKARESTRRDYGHGLFNVLHMTSTESERKGTKVLLAAWKTLKDKRLIPKTSGLHIMMNPTHVNKVRWWASDLGLGESDVLVSPGLVHGRGAITALYNAMHLVCQPSRAEGFGLVPLEALACGTPIAITVATGHTEFAGTGLPGMIEVAHGENAQLDDYAGSVAPRVTSGAIVDAIREAYERWLPLEAIAVENAAALATEWAWERKNAPAIRAMLDGVQ